jgi:hypothetical protein
MVSIETRIAEQAVMQLSIPESLLDKGMRACVREGVRAQAQVHAAMGRALTVRVAMIG